MKLNFIVFASVLCSLFCISIQECRYAQGNYFNRVALCAKVTNLTAELRAIDYYEYLIKVEVKDSDLSTINQNFTLNYYINELMITNCTIDNIDTNAFISSRIRYLSIENCRLGQMGPSSFNSSTLEWLSLRNNSIYTLKSDIFSKIARLKRLDLSYNNIGNIEGYANFTSLTKLDLSHNYYLPPTFLSNFQNMTNLKEMNVSSCSLYYENTRPGFHKLKSLEKIDISRNNLFALKGDDFPPSLLHLNANKNYLLNLINSWQHLQNLTILDLSYNHLSHVFHLDSIFDNCISLTTLNLNNNKLNEQFFKNKWNKLNKLSVVRLDNNLLTELDCETFANNTQLQEISVSMNKIDSIINIKRCPKTLQKLNVSNNELSHVKSFSELYNLQELDISNNGLEAIDYNTFKNLKNLDGLYLHHNKLNSWPIGCFRELNKLKTLQLQYNFISNLSHGSFSGLEILNTLNMSYNELKEVDGEVFVNLKSLALFDISWNKLENFEVSSALSHIKHLVKVNLDGNKYSCSTLVKILKSSDIVYGNTFDEYNVNGVQCDYGDENDSNDDPLPDMIKSISWNLYFVTVILILLIVIVVGYIVVKCVRKYFSNSASSRVIRYRKEDKRPVIQLDC